jgi:hypothetical protein
MRGPRRCAFGGDVAKFLQAVLQLRRMEIPLRNPDTVGFVDENGRQEQGNQAVDIEQFANIGRQPFSDVNAMDKEQAVNPIEAMHLPRSHDVNISGF